MKIKLLFVSLLICMAGFSQDFILKRKLADSYYNQFDFYKALPMYEQLLKSHPDDLVLIEKLATGYDHINDSENAERCYAFLVKGREVKPEYLLNYARTLSRNSKYIQAMNWYTKYSEAMPQDPRGAAFSEAYQNMVPFYRDSASFEIRKAPFSSMSNEFSPAYFGKSILFASDKSSFSMVRSSYNWTQSSFLDLYLVNPETADVKPFSDELNSAFHEGPVTFNKNQDTIVFTRSNYFESHLSKSANGVTKLGLFQANLDKKGGKWADIHPLSLNNNDYSVQHPALSPDGDKLYYASDMPGGMGCMDLYVSHRITDTNGKAAWGVPVNLGPGINTPGLEVFPFIDDQGNLWFASNGIPGLGGLDIFLAVKSGEGFSKTINPGYPLNTRFDDFGLITQTAGKEGYFSSDRNNSFGNDDIYQFNKQFIKRVICVFDSRTGKMISGTRIDVLEEGTQPGWFDNEPAAPVALTFNPFKSYKLGGRKSNYKPEIIALTREQLQVADTIHIPLIQEGPVFLLNGLIYNASDRKPIPAATAMVFNKSIATGHELKSDKVGLFHFGLLPETDYQITVADGISNSNCSAPMLEISTKGLHRDSTFNLSIPVYCAGDVIAMEDIYYDLNKFNIRPDAAKVLDKLLKLMLQYPNMKIELRSHTDSRASAGYNLKLSENRAKSAAAYLYSKGIAKVRIISKGYGETTLINKCADGIPCSEAEHQVNRRTEFKILKLQ